VQEDAISKTESCYHVTSANFAGLIAAGPAALLTFALFFLFGETSVPIVGDASMAWRVMVVALVIAPIAYVYGTWRVTTDERACGSAPFEPIGPLIARTIGLAAGAALFALFSAEIIGTMFEGYTFEWIFSSVFPAVYAGVMAYVAAAWGVRRWAGDLIVFALVIIGLAIMLAAIESGAADWWTAAISSLGTENSASWRVFNVGCMVAGAMLVLAAPSLRPVMSRAEALGLVTERTARIFPWGLVVVGVQLFVVGLVPMDSGDLGFRIHNFAGVSLGAVLVIAMAFCKLIFPGLPRPFFWYSWAFALLSMVSVPIYTLGYFSLAELEVVVFGFGALWALLMLASMRDAGVRTGILAELPEQEVG
jgi:hypothetical protein